MMGLVQVAGRAGVLSAASADQQAVPVVVARLGDAAAWHYIEFLAVHIRNPNTRRAYTRACVRFLAWCEQRGLALADIRPFDVGAYVEALGGQVSVPSVKQQLAAIRGLFDWLLVGQVMATNPAAVIGPCVWIVRPTVIRTFPAMDQSVAVLPIRRSTDPDR